MDYYGKFGHTIGRMQHISLMSIIEIYYTSCFLATQNMATTLPGFQIINSCIKYLANHTHKPIFYRSNYYDGSNCIIIKCSGNQVEYHTTHHCLEFHQDAYHARTINRRCSVLGIIHTLLGISVWWKLQIQPDIASESTYGKIRCM